MSMLLKIIGGGWALIGVLCLLFDVTTATTALEDVYVFVVMIRIVVFIIPGLLLYGMGARMATDKERRQGQ